MPYISVSNCTIPFGLNREEILLLYLTHTPDLWVRLKSDIEIVQINLFFIELKTTEN